MKIYPLKIASPSVLSYITLFILVDQILLPVPRIAGVSFFKPSYWLLAIWPFTIRIYKNELNNVVGWRKRFSKMVGPVAGFLIFGIVGQLYLYTLGTVFEQNEAVRASAFYLLMILAFGAGQTTPNFQFRWLLWLLYSLIVLVIFLAFGIQQFPILAKYYFYTPENIERLMLSSTYRVRGLANPNSTMLLINVIFLFLVIALRQGYYKNLNIIHYFLIPISTLGVCIILGSRNQLLVSVILNTTLFWSSSKNYYRKTIVTSVLVVLIFIVINIIAKEYAGKYTFVEWSLNRIINTDIFNIADNKKVETIYRPLIHFHSFMDRFLASPIIGSGYSTMSKYPFNSLPNYHNDWFRVFASSGLLGGGLFLLWMFRIKANFGYLAILPFFLPGLTNTFLRHTPSVIVYSMMLGILLEQAARSNKVRGIIENKNNRMIE